MRIAILAAGYADGIPHRLIESRKSDRERQVSADGRGGVDGFNNHRCNSSDLQVGDAVTFLGPK